MARKEGTALVLSHTNGTGFKCVEYEVLKKRFRVRVTIDKRKTATLGRFDTAHEAALHYARSKYGRANATKQTKTKSKQTQRERPLTATAKAAPPCPTTLCVWRNLAYLTLPYLRLSGRQAMTASCSSGARARAASRACTSTRAQAVLWRLG